MFLTGWDFNGNIVLLLLTIPQTFFLQVADVLYSILDLTTFELCGMYWNLSKQKISENEERRVWTTPYEITFSIPTTSTEVDDTEPFFAY